MATSNDPTLVVSSKPCQSAQTSKTSEHNLCVQKLNNLYVSYFSLAQCDFKE